MRDRIYIVDINTKMYQIARYKQNDNNVSYNMRIVQDSIDVDLTGYTTLAFFSLPSGRVTQKNCTIEGSTVYTELSHIELSEEGDVASEITLYKDDKVVTTFSTIIKVEKSINRNAIEDEPSWDIIKDILNVLSYEEERQENENVRKSNEEIRISSENVRVGNENIRIESENQRKGNEAERCDNEETRKTKELTRETNEETRKTSEMTREANEELRKTNETTREANEEIRKNNEIVRESSEETRNTNEETRENNETVRESNEGIRKTSEETRESNENTRKASEEVRNTSEETRVTSEVARQESETKRVESEELRKSNEDIREENEELRKSNEETRKVSEEVRNTSEETRNINEETRKASEEVRNASEETRNTNEESRKVSETTRETNEETRKANEITRQSSETKREENEELRKSNEETRELNESTRQTSIINMQKKVDDKVDEVDNKIIEVDTAKTDMTTTVSNKITEFEKRFNELENLDTAGEILQSKETTDGQIKDTLKERLTYDFNKLDLKIEQLIAGGINVAFNKSYDTSEWIEVDGGFELSVEHNLVTQKILVSSIDKLNKKSLITSYKIIDDNNIVLFNEIAIDIEITVVNGGSTIELIKFTINDDIESLESTYSSIEIKRLLKDGLDKKANLEHVHDIYVEKVEGKGLSTEDYTTEEKEKLSELDTFKNKETKFNTNGSITEVLDNNIKYITKFNANGSISKEKYMNDILISTTITNFENGMIQESVTSEGVI
ncbi:hypothetical protein KW94_10955 [Clostridioides difficile]|nr:hypothetical protein KW94_10955 [Clostridioides difficile]